MWRSESFVCGGVIALPHYGAALDFVVDGDNVTMRTFVDQLTYRLAP
jgi:hypothetical protein